MKKTKALIHSMRLRTLPLSLAGVVLGILLACEGHSVSWPVAVLTLLTTVLLQILSNMSNELGDYLQGTDGEGREGPLYSLSEGLLTERDFRRSITVLVALCCFTGAAMTWLSWGTLWAVEPVFILALGACAIWAAMRYTLGRNPYGYRGLGDVAVFIFFGLVPVLGGYYVVCHEIDSWLLVLPAVGIGCFSVAVLNVNNIRDMKSDAGTRVTLPLLMGERRAKVYQTALIVVGWAVMLVYVALRYTSYWQLLFILTLPLYVKHLLGVWRRHGHNLDPMLPLLVISTFLLALLLGEGFLLPGIFASHS